MSWSPEVPTKEGNYWLLVTGAKVASLVELDDDGNTWFFGADWHNGRMEGLWWGPLEPPPGPDKPLKNHVSTGTEDA